MLINNLPPILEGDTGCWSCPCDEAIFEFIVGKNPYNFFIEGKSVAVQGVNMIDNGSLHGGYGMLTKGGSGDFFIGKIAPDNPKPLPHG